MRKRILSAVMVAGLAVLGTDLCSTVEANDCFRSARSRGNTARSSFGRSYSSPYRTTGFTSPRYTGFQSSRYMFRSRRQSRVCRDPRFANYGRQVQFVPVYLR